MTHAEPAAREFTITVRRAPSDRRTRLRPNTLRLDLLGVCDEAFYPESLTTTRAITYVAYQFGKRTGRKFSVRAGHCRGARGTYVLRVE